MTWQPAAFATDRAGVLERLQEGVADEGIERCRIGIGAGIPLRGIDVGDGRYKFYCCVGR